MQFDIYWPLLLLPIPLLVYLFMPTAKTSSESLSVPFLHDLEAIGTQQHTAKSKQLAPFIFLAAIWALLIIACCRPVYIGEPIQIPTEARDMLLAVDISGSMDERDMLINKQPVMRIDSVKYVLSDFIERRAGDRLGLILFADNAYLQTPLTYDTHTVKTLLQESQLGFAGQKTAIGDAIGLAIKRLVERPAASRTLILLTDGANNAGNVEPLEAAALASENDITIHTIGVGAERMISRGFWGKQVVNPSRNLDELSLKKIAAQTGGQYFRAKNTDDLSNIYKMLDEIEPVNQDEQVFRPKKQLFHYPLGIAFGLICTLLLLHLSKRIYTQFKPKGIT